MKRAFIWIGVFVFLLIIGVVLSRSLAPQRDSGPAPDFTVDTFDHGSIQLSELQGKVVMIDIWASWCIPCREEAAELEALWQQYQADDFILLGVAYSDTERGARAFIAEYGITYPNGPDIGLKISDMYGLQGVPEKYIVDKQGEIQKVFIGPASIAEYKAVIDPLLNQ